MQRQNTLVVRRTDYQVKETVKWHCFNPGGGGLLSCTDEIWRPFPWFANPIHIRIQKTIYFTNFTSSHNGGDHEAGSSLLANTNTARRAAHATFIKNSLVWPEISVKWLSLSYKNLCHFKQMTKMDTACFSQDSNDMANVASEVTWRGKKWNIFLVPTRNFLIRTRKRCMRSCDCLGSIWLVKSLNVTRSYVGLVETSHDHSVTDNSNFLFWGGWLSTMRHWETKSLSKDPFLPPNTHFNQWDIVFSP